MYQPGTIYFPVIKEKDDRIPTEKSGVVVGPELRRLFIRDHEQTPTYNKRNIVYGDIVSTNPSTNTRQKGLISSVRSHTTKKDTGVVGVVTDCVTSMNHLERPT